MAQYYVGVDVGGTTVKMGMFSDTGELLDKWEIPTRRKDNGQYILSDIVDSIEEKEKPLRGISKESVLVFRDRLLLTEQY